jgi:hypothetical protein
LYILVKQLFAIMKMKITRVVDKGTHDSERVEFTVLEDCKLKYYQIIDTTYLSENTISNKMRHMHWFYDQDLKAGDEVWLYTKSGKDKSEPINRGKNTRYIRFWKLDNSVWNNTGDAAVLFELNTWQTHKVN